MFADRHLHKLFGSNTGVGVAEFSSFHLLKEKPLQQRVGLAGTCLIEDLCKSRKALDFSMKNTDQPHPFLRMHHLSNLPKEECERFLYRCIGLQQQ